MSRQRLTSRFAVLAVLFIAYSTAAPATADTILPGLVGNDLTTQYSGTVTYSVQKDDVEGAAKAFDDSVSTKWYTGSGIAPYLIQYDFDGTDLYEVTSYTITSANDDYGRDPHVWQLLGSNNGIDWTVLDDRTAAEAPVTDGWWTTIQRHTTRQFVPESTGTFNIYRFQFTQTEGTTQLQLSEIELIGAVVPEPSSLLLATIGLLGLGFFVRHRKR